MTSVCPYTWVYVILTPKPRAHASWLSPLPSPKARQRQSSSHLQAGDTETSSVDICVFWVFTGAFATPEDWWQRSLTETSLGLSSTLHTGKAICYYCTVQAFRIRFSAVSSPSPLFVPTNTLSHRRRAKKDLWRHGVSENVIKSMWRNTVYARHISARETRILCGAFSWEPPLQLLARKILSTTGKGNTISISPLSPQTLSFNITWQDGNSRGSAVITL